MRRLAIAAGALAALLAAGTVAADENGRSPAAAVDPRAGAEQRTVVAYSFHGTLRCTTCLLVERGADRAIRGSFADRLADGSLAWRSVNIRLPENQHFASDYEVASWGLVLVEYRGGAPGAWRKLTLAGELVHADPGAFQRYVTAEVRAFLAADRETGGESE